MCKFCESSQWVWNIKIQRPCSEHCFRILLRSFFTFFLSFVFAQEGLAAHIIVTSWHQQWKKSNRKVQVADTVKSAAAVWCLRWNAKKNKNVKFELNSVWKLGRPRFADFLRHMTRALLQFCQRHLKEVLGPKPLIACSAKPLHSSHQQSLLHYGMAVVLVAAARVLAHWAETWCWQRHMPPRVVAESSTIHLL